MNDVADPVILLVPGDVLLMRGHGEVSKLIAWCADSVYSHAAIVADNGELIEAAPGGARRASIAQRIQQRQYYYFIDAFRPLSHAGKPLSAEDRDLVLKMSSALVNKPYPLDQLVTIGVLTALRNKVPQGAIARYVMYLAVDRAIEDDSSSQMCSELVYRSLAECAAVPKGRLAPIIETHEATGWPFPKDFNWIEFLIEILEVMQPAPAWAQELLQWLQAHGTPDALPPAFGTPDLEGAIRTFRDKYNVRDDPDRNGIVIEHPNPKLITPLELAKTPSHEELGRLLDAPD